jgi:hypothetical protein
MKKLLVILTVLMFLQTGKSWAQTTSDSTYYFVSWLYQEQVSGEKLAVAESKVVRVPFTWGKEEILNFTCNEGTYFILKLKHVSDDGWNPLSTASDTIECVNMLCEYEVMIHDRNDPNLWFCMWQDSDIISVQKNASIEYIEENLRYKPMKIEGERCRVVLKNFAMIQN